MESWEGMPFLRLMATIALGPCIMYFDWFCYPRIGSKLTNLFGFFPLQMKVAGDLLKQYKGKFKGGTFAVTWNYLRESMNTYLSQPNPVTARWEGEDHLRDPKFQLDAFRVSFILIA